MEFSFDEMKSHLDVIENRISAATQKANRDRESVKLVWVSKFHSYEAVKNAIALGATEFGENRVQEAIEKFSDRPKDIRCHIIGPVQSNKLKKAALIADCIHSISSLESVKKLEKICADHNKILDILFQVNAGEEETKSGIEIANAEQFLSTIEKQNSFSHLRFCGLMTIGKNTGIAEDSRECFAYLKKLRDKFYSHGGVFENFKELSMGMTNDLEIAIEEGATIIRIGTALFGDRNQKMP